MNKFFPNLTPGHIVLPLCVLVSPSSPTSDYLGQLETLSYLFVCGRLVIA